MTTERTFAMIKPDAVGRPWLIESMKHDEDTGESVPHDEEIHPDCALAIIERIQKAGFTIVAQIRKRLTKREASKFYREHAGKSFFEKLTDFMSSGPLIALWLEKENAIADWRAMLGPTNSLRAREEAEEQNPLDMEKWGIRAAFGTDGTMNAAHGSDSPYSAMREIEFFFPAPKKFQRTLALLKPDVVLSGRAEQVAAAITATTGLVTVAKTERSVSSKTAQRYLAQHRTSRKFKRMVELLTSGPCVALLLEGDNAVARWQLAMGPEKVSDALDKNPDSIRARFGSADPSEPLCNAVSGSSDEAAAAADIELWFPGGLPLESTVALVKPSAASRHLDSVRNAVTRAGFTITAQRRVSLSKERAEEFFGAYRRRTYFAALTDYAASGCCHALVLTKVGAVPSLLQLAGPEDPVRARATAPDSLRATLGQDLICNALHVSGDLASATRDIAFFFPALLLRPLNAVAAAPPMGSDMMAAEGKGGEDDGIGGGAAAARRAGVMTGIQAKRFLTAADAGGGKKLNAVLVEGLTQLCRAKPSGLEAVRWLGEWLLSHNPSQPRVSETSTAAPPTPRVEEGDGSDGSMLRAAAAARAESKAAAAHPNGGKALPLPDLRETNIVFVLGGPGSGKGTQCALIAKEFGYVHLSSGDLLRAEVASGSARGASIQAAMSNGELVPQSTVLALIKMAMKRSGGNRFLIDGYPRELPQAFAFERSVGTPHQVLFFDVDEETLRARLLARGQSSGRVDDNAESIIKRLRVFRSQSMPVVQFYAKLGKLRTVDGRNPIQQVFAHVKTLFQPHVAFMLGGPGSGKGTQCARIAQDFGYTHLSAGDVLRQEVERCTPDGQLIQKMVANGQMVPDSLTLSLMKKAIERSPNFKFLVDGFPVTLEQASQFERSVALCRRLVHLRVDDELLLQRLQARVEAAGGASKDRDNWDPRSLRRRVRAYGAASPALLRRFSMASLCRSVDGALPVEEVYAQVKRLFDPTVVFVLGGPGSGKGTQCARIAQEFGYVHLSAGDLLRAEVARGSPDGASIDTMIRNGQIVPVEVTLSLVRRAMLASTSDKFLIDGFPRALDQARAFERSIGAAAFTLYLDVPDEVLRERLLARGATAEAQGGVRRVDDNDTAVVKRLKVFHAQSMPVIDYYARQGRIKVVSGTGHPDEVYADVRACFQPHVVFVMGAPGSGKGTQCERLAEEFGYTRLCLTELMESAMDRGTLLGQQLAALTTSGNIIPVDLKVDLLKEAVARDPRGRFAIDGFPATLEQARVFERRVGAPRFVLFFDCPEEVSRRRLLPGPAFPTGEEGEGEDGLMNGGGDGLGGMAAGSSIMRAAAAAERDAASAELSRRFQRFLEDGMPVVEKYIAEAKVRTVSATLHPEGVFAAVRAHFQPSLVLLVGATGSGRGAVATALGKELQYTRIRVTELLREEKARNTAWGREIAACLEARRAVPSAIAIALIKRAMGRARNHRFLLDGYPRIVNDGYPGVFDQLAELEAAVGEVTHCVDLQCPQEVRASRTRASREEVERATQCYRMEKLPVVGYLQQLGKVLTVDASEALDIVVSDIASFIAQPPPPPELFALPEPEVAAGAGGGDGGVLDAGFTGFDDDGAGF